MRQPLNERYHLEVRLRKKYCLDTLKFIRYIDEGDEDGAALTSESKAHEAMEFFRISYEYKFDAVEAEMKKMLHLIWRRTITRRARTGRRSVTSA